MTRNGKDRDTDNAVLLIACGLLLAMLVALIAAFVQPIAWEDDAALQGMVLAAGGAGDWPPAW